MEHYHKVSSQLIEKSQVPNELRVGPASGRPNVLVEKAISILNVKYLPGMCNWVLMIVVPCRNILQRD